MSSNVVNRISYKKGMATRFESARERNSRTGFLLVMTGLATN